MTMNNYTIKSFVVQAAQVTARADRSRLEVRQTDRESNVTTVESAGSV